MRMHWLLGIPIMALIGSGCTTTEEHTATGAGIGAAVGAIAGHNLGHGSGDRDKGALIGAAVGGLVGNTLGAVKEEQEVNRDRIDRVEYAQGNRKVWFKNSNGSRSCVILRQDSGGLWVGPRGEYYDAFPAEDQLRPVYGF